MKNSLIQKVLIVLFVSTSVIAQEPPQNTQQPPPANAPATAETSPPVSQPSSCCHQTQSECGKGACPIKTMLEAKTKWNLGGEARFRFETRDNKDLNSAAPDHNSFTGTRVRLNVGFQPSEHLKAFIQPQFSEIWGQGTANIAGNGTLTGGVVNSGGLSDPSVSMHQAYANWEMVEDLHLIVGRQEFNYGDEVVIGPVGFSNIGRSFDAALVRSIAEKNTTDFFYSKIADEDVAGSFYAGESDFTGIYSGFSNIASIDALDLYGLYLRDRRNGSPTTFNFGTFGLRIKDNVG